jgi:hypothetical protein
VGGGGGRVDRPHDLGRVVWGKEPRCSALIRACP